MELPAESLRALGEQALEIALDLYASTDRRPAFPTAEDRARVLSLREPLPLLGSPGETVLAEYRTLIGPSSRNNGHPLMAGYVVSAGTWMGALADFLASSSNQNVTSWRSSPGPTVVEHVVVRWLSEMLGYGSDSSGILLSGGSMANLCALLAALRKHAGTDLERSGLRALSKAPVFYASDLVHHSVQKGLSILGVGSDALRAIAHDGAGRMQVSALDAAVAADRSAGKLPVAVIANGGDVNTGAVDDLEALATLCHRNELWLHVDAAYGGFAALAPSTKTLFAALGRADSVAVDAHKWLSVPVDAGCLLVKDAATLSAAFTHEADYIQVLEDSSLEGFAFWNYGPELSRRFRALKIWMTLKTYGVGAIAEAVEQNIQAARALGAAIEAADDFELLAPVGLSIVCFRYLPSGQLDPDAFNRQLVAHVQKAGRAYLSNATIDGKFALRACIVNHKTTAAELVPLLEVLRESAALVRARATTDPAFST